MSQKIELHATVREDVGKGASRRLRRNGESLPGIIYGAEEDAVSLIVDGFCKQVFRKLPMEFAVEAKALLEAMNDGLYATDCDRRIVYWSPSAERITGWRENFPISKYSVYTNI